MTCQGCESVVETAIEMLDEVESVDADRYENVVTVVGDVTAEEIADKVSMAGYEPLGEADEPDATEEAPAEEEAASDEEVDDTEAVADEEAPEE